MLKAQNSAQTTFNVAPDLSYTDLKYVDDE